MVGSKNLLQAIDLVKRYGSRTVVDRVSYAVQEGEIVGLLGRNGAGKTTSFRITIGMIAPNGGKVIFNGEDIAELPMYKRAQLGMGYLSQEPSIFQRLSVRQNLLAILESMPLRGASGWRGPTACWRSSGSSTWAPDGAQPLGGRAAAARDRRGR